MTDPLCSVVMATFNKAPALRRTLASIFSQRPPFPFEVVVVDDGSSDETRAVCGEFPVRYAYRDSPEYGNPGPARNLGYRLARGAAVVTQSDDVEHRTPDALERLVARLTPETCALATVVNVAPDGTPVGKTYCSPDHPRPFFFLGALWRRDIYAVGGNDEDFVPARAGEDKWFSVCLMRLGRTFVFCGDVVGWHYEHVHPWESPESQRRSNRIYFKKKRLAERGLHPWTARTGPWGWDGEANGRA